MNVVAEPRLIAPGELEEAAAKGVVVDVREPREFAALRLPASRNVPLSRLDAAAGKLPKDRTIILVSRGTRRAKHAARKLGTLGFSDVRVLDGGLRACGVLAEEGRTPPWTFERRLRAAAGVLVLLGAGVAFFAPAAGWFLTVGAGAALLLSSFFWDR